MEISKCDGWWHGEEVVFVGNVPAHLPRTSRGRRLHVATVYRWAQSGMRGVRLRTFRCGARLATTREELDRFFAAVTARWESSDAPPDPDRLKARGLV